jgi:UDPglucose 6-dehydrogenase
LSKSVGSARVARRLVVVGAGYVGLPTGACLASLGHSVVCADIDVDKVERLSRGEVEIFEPVLAELVTENVAAGRLRFVVGAGKAVAEHVEPLEINPAWRAMIAGIGT